MYIITRKRIHQYTCVQYENRKVASSALKGCVSNSRLCYVYCFRIPTATVGNHLICVASNSKPMIFDVDMRSFSQSYRPTASCLLRYTASCSQSELCNLTILSYQRTRIVVILVAQDRQLIQALLASNRPQCTSGLRQVKVIPLFMTKAVYAFVVSLRGA